MTLPHPFFWSSNATSSVLSFQLFANFFIPLLSWACRLWRICLLSWPHPNPRWTPEDLLLCTPPHNTHISPHHPNFFLSVGKCFPNVPIPYHMRTPTNCLICFPLVKYLTHHGRPCFNPSHVVFFPFCELFCINQCQWQVRLWGCHTTFSREDVWAVEDHLIHGLINWLHEQWKGQIIQNFFWITVKKRKKQTQNWFLLYREH